MSLYRRIYRKLPDEHGLRKILYGSMGLICLFIVGRIWTTPEGILWAKIAMTGVFGLLAGSMWLALATYSEGESDE